VALRVMGRADAEAGAGGSVVAERGAGGSPPGLPAAARHLVEGERFRVVDGVHDGNEGILIPDSIDATGFGKWYADIATRDGGIVRCRAEDLERIE
jgi:hypothetical protein